MTCPHCRQDARFKGYRPKGLLSALGPLTIERAYYHCPHCQQGHCPGDAAFGLDKSDLTAGAAELTTLAGTLESFPRAAEVVLPKMSGLSIAESTVERTTEAIGAELGRAVEAKVAFDEARAWDWHKDAEGMTCAYVSIDLTGVAKQGPGGSAADGEMAAVGMVYNPVPDDRRRWADPQGRRPDWQARYVASLEGQEAVADALAFATMTGALIMGRHGSAQQPAQPGRGGPQNALLQAFDTDRDGKLSAAEIDAAAKLRERDTNKDGSCSWEAPASGSRSRSAEKP